MNLVFKVLEGELERALIVCLVGCLNVEQKLAYTK